MFLLLVLPAAAIPAAIAAGGSLLSGIINHFSNKSLSNNAYRQNLQMWHEQNTYNSPISQVARLREAGLNPALSYGASGQVLGNSEQAPQLDYGGVMNNPLIRPEIGLEAVQAMNLDSITQKNRAETVESLYRGVLSGARADYAKQYAIEELRSMSLQNDKVYKECEQVDQTINNLIANRNLTKEQIDSLRFANEFAERTMEYRIEATQLQNEKTRKEFKSIEEVIKKYSAETGLIYAKIREQTITNSMLPGLLQNNLDQGLQTIENLKSTGREIQATIDKIASETGKNRADLANYFWLNAPSLGKYAPAAAGALADDKKIKKGESPLSYIPTY